MIWIQSVGQRMKYDCLLRMTSINSCIYMTILHLFWLNGLRRVKNDFVIECASFGGGLWNFKSPHHSQQTHRSPSPFSFPHPLSFSLCFMDMNKIWPFSYCSRVMSDCLPACMVLCSLTWWPWNITLLNNAPN